MMVWQFKDQHLRKKCSKKTPVSTQSLDILLYIPVQVVAVDILQ